MTRFVVGLLFVMAAGPAIAGAGVGQSIWKQEQAYQRALQSKPADATAVSYTHLTLPTILRV